MTKDDLLNAVLALPRSERQEIARELVRSLGDDQVQERWDEGWSEELNRRIGELWGGSSAAGVPSDEVITKLQNKVSRCGTVGHRHGDH